MLRNGKGVKKFLGILLVALFLSYYAGITSFTHTHEYTWGAVTHSHPFAPNTHHSHTATGINLIAGLTSVALLIGIVTLLTVLNALNFTFRTYTLHRVVNAALPHCPLRAPPVY